MPYLSPFVSSRADDLRRGVQPEEVMRLMRRKYTSPCSLRTRVSELRKEAKRDDVRISRQEGKACRQQQRVAMDKQTLTTRRTPTECAARRRITPFSMSCCVCSQSQGDGRQSFSMVNPRLRRDKAWRVQKGSTPAASRGSSRRGTRARVERGTASPFSSR